MRWGRRKSLTFSSDDDNDARAFGLAGLGTFTSGSGKTGPACVACVCGDDGGV